MWDPVLDLALGAACLLCGRPGRPLCSWCGLRLPRVGRPAWPWPTPPGLAPPLAAGEYAEDLRTLVNAHKEHGVVALAAPLGDVLAGVVASLVGSAGGPDGGPVLLVPVPSRPSVVRSRGHDPLLRIARRAAGTLRGGGLDARVRLLLLPTRRVRDQSVLDAGQRAANLHGAFRCRPAAGDPPGAPLVVVDDVLTTGATAREAQRALEDAGRAVLGIATIAATRRRAGPRPAAGPGGRLPLSGRGD